MSPPESDPVLEEITRLLVDRCAPERVVLFGSRARGDHHPESDYDLIVVLDTPLDHSARTAPVREALGKRTPKVDVIVYTPAEFDRRRGDVGDLAYAGEVEGRILYDRRPGRWPKQVREDRQIPPESLAAWLQRARGDFGVIEILARVDEPHSDAIVFHAHEAVEKLLKSVLVSRFIRPPRTHVLPDLLERCPTELRGDPHVVRACLALEALSPEMRYPPAPVPDPDEVTRAIEDANVIRQAVRAAFDIG